MLRTPAFLIISLASLGYAETAQLTVTSAASGSSTLSAESLATAIGTGLASVTTIAQNVPWPTDLGGVTVQVIDSGNVSRPAGLLFVSPGQVNFQVPAGTALGVASVIVTNGSTAFAAQVPINPVAPAIFSVGTDGIAAASAVRVVLATRIQTSVPVFLCLDPGAGCRVVPLEVGVDAPVYLSFYVTGIKGRSQSGTVAVKIGSVSVDATYAGPQGQFPGLDQINVPLPLSLRGAGTVDVAVTVDGVTSNSVKIGIQ